MKKYVRDKSNSDRFYIESAATSCEEIGNPVYPPVKRILNGLNIDCSFKRARKVVSGDYDKFDHIIGMDEMNVKSMVRFFGGDEKGKINRLLDFCDVENKDVADPWYTRDFESAKRDIERGLDGFYKYLEKNNEL